MCALYTIWLILKMGRWSLGRPTTAARAHIFGLQTLLAVLAQAKWLDKFFILTSHFLICVTAKLIELRSDCHLITHGDYMWKLSPPCLPSNKCCSHYHPPFSYPSKQIYLLLVSNWASWGLEGLDGLPVDQRQLQGANLSWDLSQSLWSF